MAVFESPVRMILVGNNSETIMFVLCMTFVRKKARDK